MEINAFSHVLASNFLFLEDLSVQYPLVQVKIVLENDDYSYVITHIFIFIEDLSLEYLRSSGQNCTGKRCLFSCPCIQFFCFEDLSVHDPVVQVKIEKENKNLSHVIKLNFIFMEGLSVQDLSVSG